ncbi:hypothetical protein N8I77_007366 [Diaporthe amygdali]|uniref:Cargo-transport protein ypp1 n=1 Tax=Phomopsis amygdali TaxID=1214568 RepID=A0AAD9W408_PHOAM|nr:hypothetical protein N8I77_007366 [Diaporthe amygdali]
MAPNATKGRGYLDQLDTARCEGDWEAVPELIRKVRKHAPNRACLALTAEIEHGIVKSTKSQKPTARPDTAGSGNTPATEIEVAGQLPKLLTLIDEEHTYAEDRFQAQVCVGWLHWVVGEYNLAFVRLPEGLEENQVESLDNISEWTRVCMLKSAYLRANCLARNGKEVEALTVFESAIPPSTFSWSSQTAKKELRYWSELFLTEYCMLFNGSRGKGDVSLEDDNSLASFRSWGRWWDASKGPTLAGGYGFKGSVPRRRIWFEYYEALSTILQEDLPYPMKHIFPAQSEPSARGQLLVELKRAETSFEGLLLSETTFPKADEDREEVELFVEMFMRNWTILTGRGWSERDLGQGGKAGLSASTLEMLYRASTKTFHSTAILRNLFIVHLAVAEFDLALKAFDSYLDIVKKGKARVEKTGHQESTLDDDATMLDTICLCISVLSRFGGREAAEKAKDLASELEHWLGKIAPPQSGGAMASVREDGGRSSATGDRVPAKTLALAWQSIGLAQAQWARTTFDPSSRTEVQKKAIKSLRVSLSADFATSADVRGVFALGLLLAEQRELTTAIELVKTALLTRAAGDELLVLHNGPFWRERSLIPLWHLLSLLLSARQEYVLAARTCECAFEQFRDPVVLFGRQSQFKSDHLNEAEKDLDASQGLVDEMDDFEKENILEIKMTQLAIVEITEGPRVAVNASLELLTLFSRLFGSVQSKQNLEPPKAAVLPRTSGTFRSIRSGIFGNRNSRAERRDSNGTVRATDENAGSTQPRPQTQQTIQTISRAPTIQITQENGSPRTRRKSTSNEKRSESARRNSLRKRESQGARRRAASTGPAPHVATVVDGETFYTPMPGPEGLQASDFFTFANKRNPLSRPSSASRANSQLSDWSARPPGPDMTGIALEGIEPVGAVLPVIQFDKDEVKARRSAILLKVWLMIAGFYRRAEMYDDAKGAVNEAQKLVQTMESEIGQASGDSGKKSSGSSSLRKPGWGGQKSIEELWADVWSENAHLQLGKGDADAARKDFEAALTHFPDHPAAVVGLSNILLDLYCEKTVPPPAFPSLDLVGGSDAMPGTEQSTAELVYPEPNQTDSPKLFPTGPLGLGAFKTQKKEPLKQAGLPKSPTSLHHETHLEPPYKAASIPKVDRLASRDRAYGLLSNLTKLGTGWNYSEAWFALARAHEESGQLDKAKDVLWWCVELEEGSGVRQWDCVNTGGYVL